MSTRPIHHAWQFNGADELRRMSGMRVGWVM